MSTNKLADANKLMTDARFKGMKAVASLAEHTNYAFSVAFSPDGQHIVLGSLENLVKVWSVSRAGRRLRRWLDTRMVFTRMVFGRSPSVPMGNILFLEVTTSW